jgi:hypothetical protein
MKVYFLTICLDAMPFLPIQLATFNRLTGLDWTWLVVEGAADNTHCTKWCQKQEPRLSRDGSHEFLVSIREHPRVKYACRQLWDGKVEMCNALLPLIKEESVLIQIDADELWAPDQIERIVEEFRNKPALCTMQFFCRYFLGHNIITTGEEAYGNRNGEWLRAWRFRPGDTFSAHEPPILKSNAGLCYDRDYTRRMGLVFDHWAYVFPEQVQYKQQFYGYSCAIEHWRRLQQNKRWPVTDLQKFLPWVGPGAGAQLLFTNP